MSNSKKGMTTNREKLIVVFTHTNYMLISGGTEKFVREYSELIRNQGAADLAIFPLAHRGKHSSYYVGILYKGSFLGIYNADEIERVISWHIKKYQLVLSCIVIQHLKNSNLNVVCRVVEHFNVPTYLFIHDFYSICCNTRLIDDNGNHCGYATPNSDKCETCSLKEQALEHFKTICAFYEKIDVYISKIFVPSTFVRDKIAAIYSQWINRIEVRPHIILSEIRTMNPCQGKIKLAYVGAQIKDKGYDKWTLLVKQLSDRCPDGYEFFYFGYGTDTLPEVKNIYVAESTGQKMEALLKQYDIDAALFWSKCGETYSYVYYEMSLAGVFVITNSESGNVAYEVSKNKNGIAFTDYEEALKWFSNTKEVKKQINDYRKNGSYRPMYKHNNEEIYLPDASKTEHCCECKNKRNNILTFLYYAKHIAFHKGERKIV